MRFPRTPKILLRFSLGWFFLTAQISWSSEILIVTSATYPSNAKQLSQTDSLALKDAFLGKPAQFSDGTEMKAIDRKDGSTEIRVKFYETFIQRSLTQMKAYWSQIIFTGKGYPPPVAEDLASLKKLLQATPGAVTYIDSGEDGPEFKVISRIQTK